MAQEKMDLSTHALNAQVDLKAFKPSVLEDSEILSKISSAWTKEQEGIRAVIENRMQRLREEILFTATPYELISLRDRLAELSTLLVEFETFTKESAERAKKRETDAEEADEDTDEEEEPTTDKSSM